MDAAQVAISEALYRAKQDQARLMTELKEAKTEELSAQNKVQYRTEALKKQDAKVAELEAGAYLLGLENEFAKS